MNIQELKRKANKIINDQEIPDEIKQKIEEVYKDYEETCIKCKYLLPVIVHTNNENEIKEILRYITRDIEDNKESIDNVTRQEYEIIKEKLAERIERELDKLEKTPEKTSKRTVLAPILFDNEEEERNYKENENRVNIENPEEDRENIEVFINGVMNNMIAEMVSSKKYIGSKIKDIKPYKDNETEYISLRNITKKKFEEGVEYAIEKTKKEVPELGKILEKQINEIYIRVKDAIEEYREANPQEKTEEEQASDFRKRLSENIKVDEQEALKKAEEKNNDKTLALDGNVIS